MSTSVTHAGFLRSASINETHSQPPAVAAPSTGHQASASTQRKRDQIQNLFAPMARSWESLKPVKIQKSPYFATIGIGGGMGTEAGIDTTANIMNAAADFLRQKGVQVNDQAFPKMVLYSDGPGIQDRTGYLKKKNISDLPNEAAKDKALQAREIDNPLFGMLKTIGKLRDQNARLFVIPCNTAHRWAKFYGKAAGKMEHVHIVDAAIAQAMKKPAIKAKLEAGETVRLGLMATDGTVSNRIYQNRLAELAGKDARYRQFEFVTPDAAHQAEVMHGIYGREDESGVKRGGVKVGDKEASEAHFHAAADHLKEQGVDALVQACTEIPVGMPADRSGEYKGTPIVNPNTALAESAVARSWEIRQAERAKESEPSAARKLLDKVMPEGGTSVPNPAT